MASPPLNVRPLPDSRPSVAGAAGLSLLLIALVLAGCSQDSQGERRAAVAPHQPSKVRHTFYVAPWGSDAWPGTRRRPFETLARALKRLRYGHRLYVRGGIYRERIKLRVSPGRRGARVRVRNFPGERPLLRGQLWLGDPSHWTIRGLRVAWARTNPNEPLVRIYGGTGWRLSRSRIWGASSTSALQVDDGPRDNLGRWAVTGNCIHDTIPTNGINQDHNIYVADMSDSPHPSGTVSHNILFNAENGRGIKLGPGGDTGGAVNVEVSFNTIYNSSQNVSLSRDTTRVKIERNILVKARQANVTAFKLRGRGNVVRQNIGDGAPRFLDKTTSPGALLDGGGNLRSGGPKFDSIGCGGFRPTRFKAYGAYG
jgi:hypothetical protein